MKSKYRINSTAQNRLIIGGLVFSTLLIMVIAIFVTINIQRNLNSSYQNFGQALSKILAIEATEVTEDATPDEALKILKKHSNSILKFHKDILFIEYFDKTGKSLYLAKKNDLSKEKLPLAVSSPIMNPTTKTLIGSVTIGLSGSIINKVSATTRVSILFVFIIVWLIFAFVILINTFLITRELRLLHHGVKKISSGEFGYRIENEEVSQEIKELFNAFNNMSIRLHIYEEQNIEQLTLERNKLEAILMSIANGVIVCDNNDTVVLVNNKAKELLEIEEDQLIDTNIEKYVDTEGNYCFASQIEEYKHLQTDKKQISFNISIDDKVLKSIISPMYTQSNDYVGYIIVMIDITRESEMDVMKSQFISNVSHELRTPVTVLRSYIDTLYNYGDDFDKDTKKEFIETLNTEIIRLHSMVNDILDFSRLESNAKIEKSTNNILELVDTCVEQMKILLKENNLSISVEKEDNIPLIEFNYDSIARALTNYLSNAIKYAPKDSTITVKVYQEEEKNRVTVTVRDEGIGIAPEFQKKIFERFYRVENKTHSVKGTGLGLHLVKTTIEKHHHGNVFVISQPNCGATFGFSIPLTNEDRNEIL